MSTPRLCNMSEAYLSGDPRPKGYTEHHDWARIQYNAGLRQRRCPHGKLLFPQELPCEHEEGTGADLDIPDSGV